MEETYTFTDVDKRNEFITKLYKEGKQYTYTDSNKHSGIFTVKVLKVQS